MDGGSGRMSGGSQAALSKVCAGMPDVVRAVEPLGWDSDNPFELRFNDSQFLDSRPPGLSGYCRDVQTSAFIDHAPSARALAYTPASKRRSATKSVAETRVCLLWILVMSSSEIYC